ncbi:uncharacterized protein LOC126816362 isoform X2 [Patella vulgata]|uniref:uncharacterized protein LOC126816362 isoform X2 n=1 Tax=Patella vulgata TaxID=6465 RepID=UPI00217FE438|nr:uncharacterized protein LOC126816362 isoform X2 [Patella vulgata]
MSQSVFHVSNTESSLNSDVQGCYEAMSAFSLFSHQFDGAGSHLMQSIAQAMQGTPYQHVADDCVKNFNEIFMARQTLKGFEQYKTMETALFTLKSHLDAGNRKDLSKIYAQTFFHILLQFVQMQNNYYNFCHEKIVALVSRLNPKKDGDMCKQKSLDSVDSPSKEKSVLIDSHNPKTPKSQSPKHQPPGNLKSSFFSFFEKKSVARDKQSAFYVDVQEEKVDYNGGGGVAEGNLTNPPPPIITCDDTSAQAHNTSFLSSSSPNTTNSSVPIDLASEEEIDSVINLLSGVGVQSSNNTMQAIPENQIQLTVPQLYRMPSPASDSHIELKPPHFQMHRRSEGSLDLPSMQKNIWNPPLHRSSLPGVNCGIPRPFIDNNNINMGSNFSRRYSHDLHVPLRSSSPYVPATNQLWPGPGSQWLTPTMNNTWLYNNASNTHGSDTMNSSWSGVQDSSDISDDDSCGEQFFAVGQDLVQALDSKYRDHSSDEEKDKGDNSAINNKKKMSNTWPLPQTWENVATRMIEPGGEFVQLPNEDQMTHRPVQMQWSDPMSTHSMWPSNPPGVPQQRHSQSMQGFSLYQ